MLHEAQHLTLAALGHPDELLVLGAASLPPLHHLIPGAGAIPLPGPGGEMGREGTVDRPTRRDAFYGSAGAWTLLSVRQERSYTLLLYR